MQPSILISAKDAGVILCVIAIQSIIVAFYNEASRLINLLRSSEINIFLRVWASYTSSLLFFYAAPSFIGSTLIIIVYGVDFLLFQFGFEHWLSPSEIRSIPFFVFVSFVSGIISYLYLRNVKSPS